MEDKIKLMEKVYLQSARCWLGLDKEGKLWLSTVPFPERTDWQAVKFNEVYHGYYPSCKFTSIAITEKDFVAVGTGEDHLPYVYRSLMGGVWENTGLLCRNWDDGYKRASSEIINIFYDIKNRQIFFPCKNGELITLPDCPKCIKITKVSTEDIKQAEWSGEESEHMVLTTESDNKIRLNINGISQFQVTFSYAVDKLTKEGYLVDLREQKTELQGWIEPSRQIHIKLDNLEDWLSDIPSDTFLFFICINGTRAEFAAYLARRRGYRKAFCIGKVK